MRPPPIRYPLPTLILVALAVLLVRGGEAWSRPLRARLAERWTRYVEGPPPPASAEPKVRAGPIVRQVLLLRDGVAWSDRPGGPAGGTIRLRQFADLYDVWPLQGPPTHYRVGNRRPFGWIDAADALPWDTRLVLRPEGDALQVSDAPGGPAQAVGTAPGVPLPVLDWDGDRYKVAVWARDRPWERVARIGWVGPGAGALGAWVSQVELGTLVEAPPPANAEAADAVRVRALLGRLADVRPLAPADLAAARSALPPAAFRREDTPRPDDLLRLYESWRPDASWAGFTFRAIPLSALP